MTTIRMLALSVLALILVCPLRAAEMPPVPDVKPVAVVKAQYDRIETVLKQYRVDHDVIELKEFEREQEFAKYRAIFFPCGIMKAPEENIKVSASGYSIHNVVLDHNFDSIDTARVCAHIRGFVFEGGSAYFSDFSYFLLQGAYSPLSFHDDFPHLGMSDSFQAGLKGRLRQFAGEDSTRISIAHSAWVAVRSARDSDTLAEGRYKTPLGERQGPVAVEMKRGGGNIIFTSCHSEDAGNPLMRYAVFQTAFTYMVRTLENEAYRWGQIVRTGFADMLAGGESVRSYEVFPAGGVNTVYLLAREGSYQVDVMGPDGALLRSIDSPGPAFFFEFDYSGDGPCRLRVFPGRSAAYVPFAIALASGPRVFPHFSTIIYVSIFIFALTIIFVLVKLLNPRRLSGRLYKTFDRFKTQ